MPAQIKLREFVQNGVDIYVIPLVFQNRSLNDQGDWIAQQRDMERAKSVRGASEKMSFHELKDRKSQTII